MGRRVLLPAVEAALRVGRGAGDGRKGGGVGVLVGKFA